MFELRKTVDAEVRKTVDIEIFRCICFKSRRCGFRPGEEHKKEEIRLYVFALWQEGNGDKPRFSGIRAIWRPLALMLEGVKDDNEHEFDAPA